jgi:hypothetical protein
MAGGHSPQPELQAIEGGRAGILTIAGRPRRDCRCRGAAAAVPTLQQYPAHSKLHGSEQTEALLERAKPDLSALKSAFTLVGPVSSPQKIRPCRHCGVADRRVVRFAPLPIFAGQPPLEVCPPAKRQEICPTHAWSL